MNDVTDSALKLKELLQLRVEETHSHPRPAKASEVRRFLADHVGNADPGDYVRWREGMADSAVPAEGDECIVTQVFDEPLLFHTEHTGDALITHDFAILVVHRGPAGEPVYMEISQDSRRFEYIRDSGGNVRNIETELDDGPAESA